jgi:hypothetical protein
MLVDKKFFQCCMHKTMFLITYSVYDEKKTYAVCEYCQFFDWFSNYVIKKEPYREIITQNTSKRTKMERYSQEYAYRYMTDGSNNELFQQLNMSKKEFGKISERGMEIADNFIMSLVNDGFIDRYKFQKRRLKYQFEKITQKRQEVMAMKNVEALREIYYDQKRLEMADRKIQTDQLVLKLIFIHASHIPEVRAQFDSLYAAKL